MDSSAFWLTLLVRRENFGNCSIGRLFDWAIGLEERDVLLLTDFKFTFNEVVLDF